MGRTPWSFKNPMGVHMFVTADIELGGLRQLLRDDIGLLGIWQGVYWNVARPLYMEMRYK